MRRNIILFSLIAALTLISSCSSDLGSNVYYGGIGGSVRDSDSSSMVSGVQVYLYTNESDRNNAYAQWEKTGGIYGDNNCLYKANTDQNGKWSVPKVIWTSKKGAWGDDYDHIPVWITYFSEDYGCWKESEKIELVSGTSNSNAVETRRSKVKATSSLTLNFREGNKNVSDTINFTLSYNDGYTVKETQCTTNNGQYTVSLSYVKNDGGVTLSVKDIKAPGECWKDIEDKEITVKEASSEYVVPMERAKYDLGATGLSGTITATKKYVMGNESSNTVVNSLNGLKVKATVNNTEYMVLTGNADYSGEFARTFSVTFSDLAVNEKITKSEGTPATIMIEVYEGDPASLIARYTLNLDDNYGGKNSISINLPDDLIQVP